MNKKTFASITGICFVIILVTVFIANIIIKDKTFSEEENRILQDKPEFTASGYLEGRYEDKLEKYADDQFLFRNFFIKIKTSADLSVGTLMSNGVYKCNDNYLMEDISVPKKTTLDSTLSALKQFKRKYSNIKMYFLLAPNTANIMNDKLPATVSVANQNKYIDKFYSSIKSYKYTPIDVRQLFKNNKNKQQLYYKTDHHWTTDGAYLAYQQSVKDMKLTNNILYESYTVKTDFRGTLASKSGFNNGENDAIKIYMPEKDKDYKNSVIYYADTKKKTTQFYQLDNLDKKDAYTVFGGSNHPMYTIKTPTKSKEKLMIIKDSYANSFIPFIAQNYREVVVIDPRYFYDDVKEIIKSEGITQILFLYNGNTFFTDDSLEMMLSN